MDSQTNRSLQSDRRLQARAAQAQMNARDVMLLDWDKVNAFVIAAHKYSEIEDRQGDLMNYLPPYIGSDFPDAPAPNKIEAMLRELAPQHQAAKDAMIKAADELRKELVHLIERAT